jgi:hypothetical protein
MPDGCRVCQRPDLPVERRQGKVASMKSHLVRIAFAAAITMLLAGCSGVGPEPYYLGRWTPADSGSVDIPSRVPLKDPVTGRPYLSVCYNKMLHDAEQVRSLVRDNCTDPQLLFNNRDLYACSLAAPVRATYSCSSLSRAALEARPNLRKDEGYTGEIGLY